MNATLSRLTPYERQAFVLGARTAQDFDKVADLLEIDQPEIARMLYLEATAKLLGCLRTTPFLASLPAKERVTPREIADTLALPLKWVYARLKPFAAWAENDLHRGGKSVTYPVAVIVELRTGLVATLPPIDTLCRREIALALGVEERSLRKRLRRVHAVGNRTFVDLQTFQRTYFYSLDAYHELGAEVHGLHPSNPAWVPEYTVRKMVRRNSVDVRRYLQVNDWPTRSMKASNGRIVRHYPRLLAVKWAIELQQARSR